MARNLKSLSKDMVSYEGKLGVQDKTEVLRRDKIIKKFAKQGGLLSKHAPALAVEIINRAVEMDNTKSWGDVMVAVGFSNTLLRMAAGNPDISTNAVVAGYENVLNAMYNNSKALAPNQETYSIVNGQFRQMLKEQHQILENGQAGRDAIAQQTPLEPTKYKGSVEMV